MKYATRMLLVGCIAASLSLMARADDGNTQQNASEKKVPAALNFTLKNIDGKQVALDKYQGKVVMVVNVASQCGLTPQYEQLQALHTKYADQGLSILAFPCNQFGKQEPGTEAEIKSFCSENYDIKFDLFAKVNVNGPEASDLYKYLTAVKAPPKGEGDISWNFEKFIIGRNGEVVARFAPRTKPDAEEVIALIEAELAKK